jgi:small subunit ribosomal protein S5
VDHAKKNLIRVFLKNTTIPYEVTGLYGAEEILLKPASEGTGIIAGGPVRAVMEMVGIQNILSKSLGSGNPANVVKATLEAFKQLKDPAEIVKLRQTAEVI